MFGALFSAAADEASALKTRLVRLVAGTVLGAAAAIVVLVALARALFVWVAWYHGPLAGHLAVAALALVVAVAGFALALAGERRPHRVVKAARDAKLQAFDTARSIGEQVSDTVRGRRGPLRSRAGLTNAVLGAVILGILLGRRF